MGWLRRFWALLHRDQIDRELDEELNVHLAMREDAYRAAGADERDAGRQASRQFGNRTLIKEQARDRDVLRWLESVLQDVVYAARQMRRSPGFAAAVIATMALGIGANAAVFTLVNAVLFRSLPFERPNDIVSVWMQPVSGQHLSFSKEDLDDLRVQATSFSNLVGTLGTSINVADDESAAERVPGIYVSWDLFHLLRVQPVFGRDFRDDDDRLSAEPVAIISYGLWQARYGGSPDILRRTVRLNSRTATIVGVMPRGFAFPDNRSVWIPRAMLPADSVQGRQQRNLLVIGRLKPGVAVPEARAEVAGIASRLAAHYPNSDLGLSIDLLPYQEATTSRQTRLILWSFMGAVGFVLLVACANVANLLLARSTGRAREIAIRAALGAGRWRVVRQLLIESIVLCFVGGAMGLALAAGAVQWFDRISATIDRPYWATFSFDPVVFAFVALLCVLTGVMFGLAPALHVSKPDVNDVLKDSGRGGDAGPRSRRWAGILIVGELTLTLVLLSGAGFMIRSFIGMYRMELGFDPTDVTALQLYLPLTKYVLAQPQKVLDFEQRLSDRLATVPDFRVSALVSTPPTVATIRTAAQGVGDARPVVVDGHRPAPGERPPLIKTVSAGDRYFETVRIPIARGRAFEVTDGLPGRGAAIVNQRFAALYLEGRDPLGHSLEMSAPGAGRSTTLNIVGVVPDVRQGDLDRPDPDPVVYIPMRMDSRPGVIGLLVRASGSPARVAARVREELALLDPDVPVFAVQTMDEILAGERWQYVTFLSVFGLFAGIALLLSSVGLYALTAYSVTERTHEIGIRRALGAKAGQIVWLMLRRSLLQLAIGVPAGIAGALAVGRLLQNLMFHTSPSDPVTIVGVTVVLALVATGASIWPAGRAARVDPLVALRHD